MLIDIETKALESILKDGIKEMICHVAGRSFETKRRCWVVVVKAAIQVYQRKVQEEFFPVLVKDFTCEKVVKFTKGKMSEEDKGIMKEFIEMVGKSSIKKFEKIVT